MSPTLQGPKAMKVKTSDKGFTLSEFTVKQQKYTLNAQLYK